MYSNFSWPSQHKVFFWRHKPLEYYHFLRDLFLQCGKVENDIINVIDSFILKVIFFVSLVYP